MAAKITDMGWKEHRRHDGSYVFTLTFILNGKQFVGSLEVDKVSKFGPKATFVFQSLGIAGKKIKIDTDENMKKEALDFLLNKINMRLTELSIMKQLIEKEDK